MVDVRGGTLGTTHPYGSKRKAENQLTSCDIGDNDGSVGVVFFICGTVITIVRLQYVICRIPYAFWLVTSTNLECVFT